MADDKSKTANSENQPVALQRKAARNRQLRKTKEIATPSSAQRARPAEGNPIARARPRRLRGAKQLRATLNSGESALPVAKVDRARPLQVHQLSSRKSLLPSRAVGGISAPKVDQRRAGQSAQRAGLKTAATPSASR